MSQLRNFTKVISKLGGRDKVNKWIQYQAKLLFYILTQLDYDKSSANKLKSLSSGISNARKVDRLLKSSIEVQKAIDAFNNNKSDEFAKVNYTILIIKKINTCIIYIVFNNTECSLLWRLLVDR